jgi:hypothetical protein
LFGIILGKTLRRPAATDGIFHCFSAGTSEGFRNVPYYMTRKLVFFAEWGYIPNMTDGIAAVFENSLFFMERTENGRTRFTVKGTFGVG